MRGECGIDRIVRGQHLLGAGQVADVGAQLAGEDGEVGEAADVAELDFGIPIGALHQPDEELAVVFARQPRCPFDHRHAALLIGLDGKAEAFPAAAVGAGKQAVVARERLEQVHRQFEPVGFFGVDGEMDVRVARRGREVAHDRQQVGYREVGMEEGVLRMQRRQLDRDPGGSSDVAGRFPDQPVDRLVIVYPVALGIVVGHRDFTEHVEAVRQPARAFGRGALERLVDRPAIDELPAENAHRLQRRPADHRLAEAVNRALERAAHALLRLLGALEHFARQHQREGRRIDEGGRAFAHVFGPVDIADLVADQRIGGCRIGHAQECLGEAHQGDAFVGRETVLVEEGVDPAGLALARILDQPDRDTRSLLVFRARAGGLLHAFGDAGIFLRAIGFADGLARNCGQGCWIVQGHTTPEGR